MRVKNIEANSGLEAWRGLNATYDNDSRRRQRARMQHLLQQTRSDAVAQATDRSNAGNAM